MEEDPSPAGGAPDAALVDTHCHLDMEIFDADRESVLERASAAGVVRCLIPALNRASALRAIGLAEKRPSLFVAIGLHPTEVDGSASAEIAALSDLAAHDKVVAIGEIGLDYYWVKDEAERRRQRSCLTEQLDLAQRMRRPVVLHMREENDAQSGPCAQDMLAILHDWSIDLGSAHAALGGRPGVLHSFSGSIETADRAMAMGFYIGVTGPITYPNANSRRETLARLPLNRLLVETDAPFLAPLPHRGGRNEPAFVAHIADKIAQIQSRTVREVAGVTTANAARLFDWGVSA